MEATNSKYGPDIVIRPADRTMLCCNKIDTIKSPNTKEEDHGLLASVYPSRLTEATLLLRDNLPGFLWTLDMLCMR